MAKSISEEEALSRLRQLCSRSEKSRQDIREKLNMWNFKGKSENIIKLLEKDNFIDEQRFCDAYVRDKIRFSGWGKIKIRYYLKGRKISEEMISEALDNYPVEAYKEMIINELNKKSKSIKEKDKLKHKQKLLAFSSQRGFEPDILYNMVDKIIDLL